MKRLLLVILTFLVFSASSKAAHITGGEIYYTFVGVSGNNYTYHVVLKLFRDCASPGAQLDPNAAIAVFDKGTNLMISNNFVPQSQFVTLQLTSPSPCITSPPAVCYQVGYYEFDITVPGNLNGYVIAYQRCCRIAGINNLNNSGNVGTTYTAEIPGTGLAADGPENNSARFVGVDTVITCANNPILYSFAASDLDGDILTYSFCNAITGGGQTNGSGCLTCPDPNPPANPPYSFVPYQLPFWAGQPMGPGVTINPTTGLITGIAPASGIYVVTVCVTETRNGVVIATQRKDLQIKVGDCDIATPGLQPSYITCDGFTMTFSNTRPNSLINSYFWDFGVLTATNDTSNLETPTFTYPDTGVYVLKLVTNRNQQCSDSVTALVSVYPGFFPGFTTAGRCISNPFQFTDTTKTNYGFVNTWSWNFGDETTLADTSHLQFPLWTYSSSGPKTVTLTVTNSKGCIKTISIPVDVVDKPLITMGFKDTLICIPDAVTLEGNGIGTINWTPPINIINANTPTPTVNPTSNTWYYINLNDNGCINKDSVHVRVVPNVSLLVRADTTICLGDAVQLNAITDGLIFQWSPAATLNDPAILNPIAIPVDPVTTYQLTARIGSCSNTDDVTIRTVPYPTANAGPNQVICYNTSAQLNATHDGITFSWSPTSYLNNPNILNPVSTPPRTTTYVLTVFDNAGCPKPGRDTIVVAVNPRVRAFAGNDTTVVVGQPMHLFATGGVSYVWSPTTGFITSNTIQNPVAVYGTNIDSVRYKVVVRDNIGCPDSAWVTIRVFKTNPSVFVPTAFTPNNDGLNDIVAPIAVGMRRIIYFSIYNRWGQLVFTTTENKKGWDGRINGYLQSTNVFVWMVSAEDYLGQKYFLKGTVTLIR